MRTRSKRMLRLLALTLVVLAVSVMQFSSDTLAKKGGKGKGGGGNGGGGGDPPLVGTVYFDIAGQMHSMNPDGSGKTPLPIAGDAEPSHSLHGGHRWFLELRSIAGQFYPDGDVRRELFAVRDDGNPSFTVQLTNDPNSKIGSFHPVRWSVDPSASPPLVDGSVSWSAVRWDGQGVVAEAGVYSAPIFFDGNGDVLGILNATLEVPSSTFVSNFNTTEPSIIDHDWSPDGSAIVFSEDDPVDLEWDIHVFDFVTLSSAKLVDGGSVPVWSPAGNNIAFNSLDGVETIGADGTGRQLVLANTFGKGAKSKFTTYRAPSWSPDGTHLVVRRYDSGNSVAANVYRAQADGFSRVDLTSDVNEFASPIAWR